MSTPEDSEDLGCVAAVLWFALIAFLTLVLIPDFFMTQEKALSSCPTGVSRIDTVLSFDDLISFDVTCVGATKSFRVN